MKISENKKIFAKVLRFSDLKKKNKNINDELTELHKELKNLLVEMNTKILVIDGYAIIITDRSRQELDRDAIERLLGETYKDYMRKIEYQTLEIKKA